MHNGSRLPHTLRLIISLLRIALGLNFFYLGFSMLFSPSLGPMLRTQAVSALYAWLTTQGGWLHPFGEWAFLLIGIALVIGFMARFVSFVGIVLILTSYLPGLHLATLRVYELISNDIILTLCLIIIIFARAGEYIGLDKFIHFSVRQPHVK